MFRTVVIVSAILAATIIPGPQAASEESSTAGRIGTAVQVAQPSKTLPCEATLREAISRFPVDLGTKWYWADSEGDYAGLYHVGRQVIYIDTNLACEYVPTTAAHEWAHALQDNLGLITPDNRDQVELVAECTARVISAAAGWPTFESYPETLGVPCSEVAGQVSDLLSVT